MEKLQLWAQPWWVNLLVLIPFVTYFAYRRTGLPLRWRQLIILASFAAAFGFVEAAVVVYLRAAIGLLPGYMGTFADLRHSSLSYTQASSLSQFPQSLLTIEVYREAATMVMLVGVALLFASRASARWRRSSGFLRFGISHTTRGSGSRCDGPLRSPISTCSSSSQWLGSHKYGSHC